MVSDVLEASKKISGKETLSDDELHGFVGQVYRIVVDKYLSRFSKENTEMPIRQYDDYAELIINTACTLISSTLAAYADNRDGTTYDLPAKELRGLSLRLSVVMRHGNETSAQIFSESFNFAFYPVVQRAQEYKKATTKQQ